MGLIFKKGKFGKKFQIRRNYFSGEFLPTKTIRQNWSGSSWVGDHTHLFLAFLVKKRKKKFLKIKNLGFWGCFFFSGWISSIFVGFWILKFEYWIFVLVQLQLGLFCVLFPSFLFFFTVTKCNKYFRRCFHARSSTKLSFEEGEKSLLI